MRYLEGGLLKRGRRILDGWNLFIKNLVSKFQPSKNKEVSRSENRRDNKRDASQGRGRNLFDRKDGDSIGRFRDHIWTVKSSLERDERVF